MHGINGLILIFYHHFLTILKQTKIYKRKCVNKAWKLLWKISKFYFNLDKQLKFICYLIVFMKKFLSRSITQFWILILIFIFKADLKHLHQRKCLDLPCVMWTLDYMQLQSQKIFSLQYLLAQWPFFEIFSHSSTLKTYWGLINFLKIPVIDELSLYSYKKCLWQPFSN